MNALVWLGLGLAGMLGRKKPLSPKQKAEATFDAAIQQGNSSLQAAGIALHVYDQSGGRAGAYVADLQTEMGVPVTGFLDRDTSFRIKEIQDVTPPLVRLPAPVLQALPKRRVKGHDIVLTDLEKTILDEWFFGTLDVVAITVRQNYPRFERGYDGITMFNTIFFPRDVIFETVRNEPEAMGLLVHEAMHCWQYQHFGESRLLARLTKERLSRKKEKSGQAGPYYFRIFPRKALWEYGIEQQAEIVGASWLYLYANEEKETELFCVDYDDFSIAEMTKELSRLHDDLLVWSRALQEKT